MATAKIEFNSPFGIYLHDTPERDLFRRKDRRLSAGCIRVEGMSRIPPTPKSLTCATPRDARPSTATAAKQPGA